MNKINTPGSSNTGVTTKSGESKEIHYLVTERVIQLDDPYICPNCHSETYKLPFSKECPVCRYRDEDLLI